MIPARAPLFPEGAPCWADARLADVEAGKRFYGDLLGWTFDEGAGAERAYYTTAYSRDRAVAALAPAGRGAQWRVHLAVRDAYAAAERVFAAGGHIVAGPLPGGTEATVALARGPEGAAFVLRQAGSHRGFERVGGPGAFRGAELLTPDAAVSETFHASVFEEGAFAGAVRRRVVDAGPGWFLLYFGCADVDVTAAAAARLGGRVRTGPHPTSYGRGAVIEDDQGAVFAVCEQPEH
ncbi:MULTISPECIES: VOC family protein [unclassified Streptomyces]|uniref:VOC family protein n=1 Tax=unclassified Streptomyces TaxID=2593676 RepID=UPI00278C0DF6|nr:MULTISPECIES: VOC family protein [unclassified Streptomyces]